MSMSEKRTSNVNYTQSGKVLLALGWSHDLMQPNRFLCYQDAAMIQCEKKNLDNRSAKIYIVFLHKWPFRVS